jgi:hypothetical protein
MISAELRVREEILQVTNELVALYQEILHWAKYEPVDGMQQIEEPVLTRLVSQLTEKADLGEARLTFLKGLLSEK